MGAEVFRQTTVRGTRSRYFLVTSIILLALTLLGFSDNLLTRVDQPSNHDIKFIVHGLCCLGWMVMLVAQTALIARGDVRLHRRLGVAGMAVAAGVVLSTLFVFVVVGKQWETMPVWARINRLFLPSFAVMVGLAIFYRHRPDRHRRLMLIASFYMMEPVLSRAFDPFAPILDRFPAETIDGAWWIFFFMTWNGLFASLALHDWTALRRLHPVTIVGYAWFCIAWAIVSYS